MSKVEIEGFACSPQQGQLWASLKHHQGFAAVTQGIVHIDGADEPRVQRAL